MLSISNVHKFASTEMSAGIGVRFPMRVYIIVIIRHSEDR